jgi:hypothetical protein
MSLGTLATGGNLDPDILGVGAIINGDIFLFSDDVEPA